MTEAFDPYRKWLGISPEEQPPDHYRLLGIGRFEDDADTISNAADRQMAHMRTYQTGKRAALSQKILTELSTAKVCLLDATKKAAYDAGLRAKDADAAPAKPAARAPAPRAVAVDSPPPASPPAGQPIPVPASSVAAVRSPVSALEMPRPAIRPPVRRGRRKKSVMGPVVGGAVGVVALALVIIIAVTWGKTDPPATGGGDVTSSDGSSPPVAAGKTPKNKPPGPVDSADKRSKPDDTKDKSKSSTTSDGTGDGKKDAAPATKDGKKDGKHEAKPDETPKEKKKDDPETKKDADKKKSDKDGDPTSGDSKTPKDKPPDPPMPQPMDTPGPLGPILGLGPADAGPKRPAVPEADALTAERVQLRKENPAIFQRKNPPSEKLRWAKLLIEEADKPSNSPARRYVVLEVARDLSIELPNHSAYCLTCDKLADHFDVDAMAMKAESLRNGRTRSKTPVQLGELYRISKGLFATAAEKGRFDLAESFAETAAYAARRAGDKPAIKEVTFKHKELEWLRSQHEAFESARAAIEKDPNDAAANYQAGYFACVVREKWEIGLPLLVRGSNETYREVARADLANPTDTAGQIAVGDRWAKIADDDDTPAVRGALLRRAREWISRAVDSAVGLAKADAQKHLAEIDAAIARSAP